MADPTGLLTPYTELATVMASLPLLLREARRARGLSVREAGRQLDVSFATVARIEQGEDYVVSTAIRVLAWLGQPPPAAVEDATETGR